jgi:hypothetical protein
MGVHLISVCPIEVQPHGRDEQTTHGACISLGAHLVGVYLMGMYLMGVHLTGRASHRAP